MRTASVLIVLIWLAVAALGPTVAADDSPWTNLSKGLELGQFKVQDETPAGDSTITILRIDPHRWELKLLTVSESRESHGLTAREWCEKYGLTAATNAGMFQTDYSTHVGYMRCGAHVNSAGVNNYLSAAAFGPVRDDLPPFRIHDLVEQNTKASLNAIAGDYECVVQNLRLIKRPAENRWPQQPKMWSEAALGEDSSGRILFIYSRSPYSMHDFNKILLSLPIDLVAAQHLEGGPEAQLVVSIGDTELELFGSYETDFRENDRNRSAWPIPNVLGIAKREPQ